MISITEVSRFLTIRFTVHTWTVIRCGVCDFIYLYLSKRYTGVHEDCKVLRYLGVKGIELQLVGAFECFRVDLLKRDPVELALKYVDLLIIGL